MQVIYIKKSEFRIFFCKNSDFNALKPSKWMNIQLKLRNLQTVGIYFLYSRLGVFQFNDECFLLFRGHLKHIVHDDGFGNGS